MKHSRRFWPACCMAAMPLAAMAQTHDGLVGWFQGVYSENDRAAAEGRGERMLLLYATRGYQHVAADGRRRGLQQSIAQWVALHATLPYGSEMRTVTTVDQVSFEGGGALVRGSLRFEMRYDDLLSGSVESQRAEGAFEDLWVREGSGWRLQSDRNLPPSIQLARAP